MATLSGFFSTAACKLPVQLDTPLISSLQGHQLPPAPWQMGGRSPRYILVALANSCLRECAGVGGGDSCRRLR
jgi:hypothetical protein